MSVKLEDYREILEKISPDVHDTLEASFSEAAHFMSPGGLRNYLEGARALTKLGRGTDIVISYLQEMPLVQDGGNFQATYTRSRASMNAFPSTSLGTRINRFSRSQAPAWECMPRSSASSGLEISAILH